MNPNDKTNTTKFDRRRIEDILKKEKHFIGNLYSILCLPATSTNANDKLHHYRAAKKPVSSNTKTTRATSLVDLQNRLDKLKNKHATTYNDKVQKKNIKGKLKKKLKQETKKNKQSKIKKTNIELEKNEDLRESKKINETKMEFSKFNFSGLGKQKIKKVQKDPKKILEQMDEVNRKVAQLKSIGESDKAVEIQEKIAWKNALAKTEGVKIKDDSLLLKKTVKKMEQRKKSSKKKWDARQRTVENLQNERQKKRNENIQKRKKDNKVNKLKKAAKKGKIIPGF